MRSALVQSSVETLSPTRVKLSVEVPFEELKPSLDSAYKRIGSQVNIPGFRRGKVPAAIIDQRFGRAAVMDEAVNDVLPKFYSEVVEQNSLKPLGTPEVDIQQAQDGQPLTFTVEIDVRPEISLPDYDGLDVEVDAIEANEAEVDEQLERLQSRFGSLKPAERAAAKGDFVTVDLATSHEGTPIPQATASGLSYEVGSDELIDGIDDAIVGLEAGGTKSFTTKLVAGEYADKDVDVEVTVTQVRERELPALDDEFAQMASEFDTLDELRDNIRAQVSQIAKLGQGLQARDRTLEKLIALVDVPVPEGVVDQEVREHLEGEGRHDDEEHGAQVADEVRSSLRRQFILDEIVTSEKLSVSEAELTEFLVRQAPRYGMTPDQFATELARSGQVSSVVGEVARSKALSLVLERANIKDTEGNDVDIEALLSDPEALEADGGSDH
jgi:trigger factor